MKVNALSIEKHQLESKSEQDDLIVVEEPLQIQIEFGLENCRYRKNLLVTMRTPGEDDYLAIGLLKSEGVISSGEDVISAKHCIKVKPEEEGNVIRVSLSPDVQVDHARLGRFAYMNSACGVCGKSTIDALKCDFETSKHQWNLNKHDLFKLQSKLDNEQLIFRHTGGLHAAALFDKDAKLIKIFEDIGRHNALDKLIGYMLINNLEVSEHLLWLSGRAGFEMVQKAANANLPMLVSVGAPSSLAVDLARESGMTLIGFAKEDRFNIYTNAKRVK